MDIIRVEDVSKSYGSRSILNNLSLTIKKGECFTLLGPSGCGKTVLLRLIAGFESPDAGRIYLDDTLVTDPAAQVEVPPENRVIWLVFQDYAVWPHMTVFDNVGYPLKIAKRPKEEIRERVMEMVEIVGMKDLEKRLPSELSGGQQQRVALARALVGKPALLLLAEPLSHHGLRAMACATASMASVRACTGSGALSRSTMRGTPAAAMAWATASSGAVWLRMARGRWA